MSNVRHKSSSKVHKEVISLFERGEVTIQTVCGQKIILNNLVRTSHEITCKKCLHRTPRWENNR